MSEETPTDLLQRRVAQVYERHGSGVLLVLTIAVAAASIVPTIAVAVAWMARFLEVGTRSAVGLGALAIGVAFVGLLIGISLSRGPLTTIREWSRSPRTPERTELTWRALHHEPRRAVLRVALATLALESAVMAPAVVAVADAPAYTGVLVVLAICAAVAANWVFALFCVDFALRPVLAEVARLVPPGFAVEPSAWGLRAKALAPIPGVTLFTALTVGGFADVVNSGPGRFAVTYAIALPVAGIAGAVLYLASRSALEPLGELISATRRVRTGNLDTPVPVLSADDLGELAVSFNEMLTGLREREVLMAAVAEQAVELRASRARIVATADAARRQVERDLHDGAQHRLVMLRLRLGNLARALAGHPCAAEVTALQEDLGAALEELRDLARGIYPSALESDGVAGALSEAGARTALPTTIECDGAGRYPRELETAVYFCCLEALQNAAKHAGPHARAQITLADTGAALRFSVRDDGLGFDQATEGRGLQNMRDRIGALGGTLRIDSAPGRGTHVRGEVPLPGA